MGFRTNLFSPQEIVKPEMTLEQFKQLVAARKVIQAEVDRMGATLDMSKPFFGQTVMQMAELSRALGMADENIKYHAPIMKEKFGYEIPESDKPQEGTKVYSVKTNNDQVQEKDEPVNSPTMRR